MILHCLARIQIQSLLERIHISNLCGLQFAKSPVHNIKHGLTAIKYFYYFPLTTKRNLWYETVGSKWKSVLATNENSHLATSQNLFGQNSKKSIGLALYLPLLVDAIHSILDPLLGTLFHDLLLKCPLPHFWSSCSLQCSVPNSSDELIFVKRRALDGPFLDKKYGL